MTENIILIILGIIGAALGLKFAGKNKNKKLDELDKKIDDNNDSIDNIKSKKETVKSDIKDIDKKISDTKKKKYKKKDRTVEEAKENILNKIK